MIKAVPFFLALIPICFFTHAKSKNGEPIELRCEHLVSPLGIDNPNPRLSWKLEDNRPGAVQTAYRILVDTDSLAVVNDRGQIWDTGKQPDDHILLTFAGEQLQPQTRYFWKVITWDKEAKASTSAVVAFETGKMGNAQWQGSWISDHHTIDHKPAPYFRKEFNLKKEIARARAYIAVAGLYELSLNGRKVGDHRLDPMYTRFDRRTLYVTHDVTTQLRSGQNALGVVLGNGWYNHQSLGVWDFHNAPWRARPTFCLDLHIVYTDGSEETIRSERDWKTSSGPITFNSIYTAEHYDARLEQPGWDSPGFDDQKWQGVRYRSFPSENIVSQQMVPIRFGRKYEPQSVEKINDSTYVFDMGQNMAGVTHVQVKGAEGTVLKIKHGERLHDDGRIDLSNIDVYYRGDKEADPFQTDILTLSGRKEDEFTAKFNYKGFRYVEISSNAPILLNAKNVTAYFMHSDVAPLGEVKTSSKLVNDLWRVTNNAYLSNLMGYPTDCPQREKNGWTGDGHLAIETALYNFEGITVYEKWIADHRDEQQPNGVLPDIIPTGGWGYGTANGLDWTSTIAIIPWQIYLFYGDSKLLADSYENIKRYVDYVERISPTGLTTFGRGDWVPVKSTSNLELTSSVYFYTDARILATAAKLFGKEQDQQKYEALSEKIKNAINSKFLNREKGIYADGTQTELSVPLFWKIVPEDMIAKVAANLNKKVEETNFHLDVGVLGAKALLDALKDNGYGATAYKVAVQDTYPSWGWWVVNGATTLLENWDLEAERDISDNHMMFGEIGGWFFKSVGGIHPDPEQPGFKHTLLRPLFPEGLEHSEVSHRSPYGNIISKWKRNKNNTVTYTVTVPANASATLHLPENAEERAPQKLLAGTHTIQVKLNYSE
ncbi:glycoside hydrolase family 78 protein [Sphingobacterium sp. lm-10]|uniref:glycoside hydrolase family 78 protein n=1 Tax=Sphingobacterium sp. lm-10 TaxID=2944904 RepID=UPI002021A351|nr:glycoside hydrolase family 78 protein [Sphingobacterium sp. lm-10]MCL7987446.1 glycoside hydrolase family 78 protein [Sphingobacterium sp. lm-10]